MFEEDPNYVRIKQIEARQREIHGRLKEMNALSERRRKAFSKTMLAHTDEWETLMAELDTLSAEYDTL